MSFRARCAARAALEEPPFCDKTRGEGSSCLWRGSHVLICDPEANEQMLHYPVSALPRITTTHGYGNKRLVDAMREETCSASRAVHEIRCYSRTRHACVGKQRNINE